MRTAGFFHPRFFYHARPVAESAQLTHMRVYDVEPGGSSWNPGTGFETQPDTLVWEGLGRFQPDKDWRARERGMQRQDDGIIAIRVQLPVGRNWLGAMYDMVQKRYVSYGDDPKFSKGMRIEIISSPVKGFEFLEDYDIYIRNPINSQNLWQYNLLCDGRTSLPLEEDVKKR